MAAAVVERLQDRGTAMRAAAGVVAVILLFTVGDLKPSAVVIGIVSGAVYGLMALGLVLIYKSSGIFNFAQGEFGSVAVYALYIFHTSGMPYIVAILLALVVAIGMGLLVERLVVRPLFEAARVTLLVATAGVALLAIGVEFWLSGDLLLRQVAPALPRLDRIAVFGINVSDQRVLGLIVLLILAPLLGLFFNRTNLGLAVLGAAQEPTATELVGISVKRLSSFTWALAALLGGLAGVLSAPIGGGTFGPGVMTFGGSAALIPGFTAAVVGGMTSLPGAFVGGIVVGLTESWASSSSLFEAVPGEPRTVAVFALLLIVLTVRPQGLLGKSA